MRKKLLAILLVLCMTLCLLPTAALAEESSFTDVEGHWAVDSIDRWAGYNVLNGKDESTFDPEGKMTRAEFAQMLVNLMGYTETSDQTFTDMTGHWAADAISKLVKAGVMNGMGDGTMDPDGKITREMAAVMLCRAFNLKPSKDASLTFADSANVSSWAKDAMAALSERDMIGGIGNNLLSPEGIVNRATAAKLADNMIGEYVTEDKVITGEVKGIVLVVNGAKAEIKDATLSAPVVVKDSTAVLTNTKADDVVADGGSVTADAKTTVANVTLTGDAPVAKLDGKVEGSVSASGTKPQVEVKGDIAGEVTIGGSDAKVDLKGEVAGGVTVAEDATGKPQVTAPKGTEVKNESETDATVNGSKVEAGGETTTTTTPSTPSTGDTGTTTPSTPSTPSEPEKPDLPEEKDPTEEPAPPAAESHTHTFDAGVTVEEATCTAEGSKKFTCTASGCTNPPYSYTETIPKTDHNWKAEPEEVEGENGGKVSVYKCQDCTATKPADHKCPEAVTDETKSQVEEIVTIQATCAVAGSKIYVCKVCGTQVGDAVTIEKLTTHTEVEIPAVAATCTKKGLTEGKKCTVCGTVTVAQTQTELAAHTLTITDNKDGKTHNEKCSKCTYSKNVNHTAATEGTQTKAPTCTEKGVKSFLCTVEGCGAVAKTEEIEAKGHDWSNKNGVCKNDSSHKCDHSAGYEKGACKTCGMAEPKYAITITPTGGSTSCKVEANPTGTVAAGTEVTLTVTADEGYQLKANTLRVMNGDTEVTATAGTGENANKYTFTMPAAAVTVTAEFEKIEYTLGVDATNKDDSITFKVGNNLSATKATKGDTVTINIEAGSKEITKVSYTKGEETTETVVSLTDTTYTFTMPAANVTVKVTFVDAGQGGGGSDEPTPQG